MKKIILSCLAAWIGASTAQGVEILAYYNVVPTAAAPVIDGKLD